MALISPGVSVTVTDESQFIPSVAPTVPLIFVTTADEKLQPDGVSPAAGTFEHDVVRTITSITQSTELYGIPRFLEDSQGRAHHGDARNEYGLLALNQFLGIGNRAFVVRANVNLNDNLEDIRVSFANKLVARGEVLENLALNLIYEFNLANGYIPGDPNYKETVTKTEFISLVNLTMEDVYDFYSFRLVETEFETDHTASPLDVFANGFDQVPTGQYIGVAGLAEDWVTSGFGSVVPTEFTPDEAANLLVAAADDFIYTLEFKNLTMLGANDAARRVAVATALQATINSNTEVRSENFEYNLILAPGFPEVADELLFLAQDIKEEAFVLSDTPMDMNTSEVVAWAATNDRQVSPNIAYYYPHVLTSNLDGKNVMGSASGAVLRTYAYSDSVSEQWYAPAGTRRGLMTGMSGLGYASGTLGMGTNFEEVNLNQGQRDDLYKYFTNVNPLVFFPGRGNLVWGNRTSNPETSALSSINISRMVVFLRRQLRKFSLPFVFQPNDQITRDNLKSVIDNLLNDLVTRRAIFDFATLSDESNNPPSVVAQSQLIVDVAIKPVPAAEFIIIPIRIVSLDAEI